MVFDNFREYIQVVIYIHHKYFQTIQPHMHTYQALHIFHFHKKDHKSVQDKDYVDQIHIRQFD